MVDIVDDRIVSAQIGLGRELLGGARALGDPDSQAALPLPANPLVGQDFGPAPISGGDILDAESQAALRACGLNWAQRCHLGSTDGVSGDFAFCRTLSGSDLFFCIGDVSGRGAAAYKNAQIYQGSIHKFVDHWTRGAVECQLNAASASDLLKSILLNFQSVCLEPFRACEARLLPLLLGIISPSRMELNVLSAGFPFAFHLRDAEHAECIPAGSRLLFNFQSVAAADLEVRRFELAPTSRLVFGTDGFSEREVVNLRGWEVVFGDVTLQNVARLAPEFFCCPISEPGAVLDSLLADSVPRKWGEHDDALLIALQFERSR